MTRTAEIDVLLDAYRHARLAIENQPDGFERSVGLASLRLEASDFYKRLHTTAAGLEAADLTRLKEYVDNLTGGEDMERFVGAFDAKAEQYAKKVLSTLWVLLTGTVVVGAGTGVGALIAGFALQAQAFGASLFGLVIGIASLGGGAFMYAARGAAMGAEGAQSAFIKGLDWAGSRGSASDQALAMPRQLQQQLWRATTGGAFQARHFTHGVRVRAQVVVWLAYLAIGAFVFLVGVGFVQAASDWWDQQTTPTITFEP